VKAVVSRARLRFGTCGLPGGLGFGIWDFHGLAFSGNVPK
jgi:hypothetical protein